MTIVFFGSSKFACTSLEKLINSKHKVEAVVTQPDNPSGRHQKLLPTPIKSLALKYKLPVYQPSNLKSKEFLKNLKDIGADLFVVVAYGKILTKDILEMPKIMPINLHASLLPKYRGAAPINWAIINGEKETGITVMKVTEPLDSGEIILQKKLAIKETDAFLDISDKLSEIGSGALIETIGLIEKGNFRLIPQNERESNYAPKMKKTDGLIDWNKTSSQIFSLWRGTLGWPQAYTLFNNKTIKLISMGVADNLSGRPGQVVDISKNAITVASKDSAISIKELQPESKKIMTASDFIQGHKIKVGDYLG